MGTSNLDTASAVLTSAFLNYPLMKYAFKKHTEAPRQVLIHRLHSRCVAASAIYGGVITTPDNQGAVIWLPGKNFPLGWLKEIRSGMAAIPFQVGIKQTLRLMQHDGESEGWIKKNADADMGYIWCIGVLKEAQGKGYSRLLMEQSMQQMLSQGLTTCWLKTEDPKNVTIYQKLGFSVMNEMVVKSSGITSWAMMKEIV
jgi:ribosomal protein S18 acetylase RimI-like enzyme